MTRALDLTLALLLVGLLALPFTLLCLWLLAIQGRPLLHGAERMRAPDRAFTLWKLRTMRPDPADSGVTGADKAARITPPGRWLRRTRLDELPQLWNILRGDMGFVGPRPPLRRYVDRFPALYARVLRDRPGVTGLATLRFHRHEERLLSACRTAAETEATYIRRCIPRKARLDLIWQRRRTLCGDLWLMLRTAGHLLPRRSRFRPRTARRSR